tara:strand:+ start:182 stop:322 length:141 start_codon:yes stop_codon:yes gene_type:complete
MRGSEPGDIAIKVFEKLFILMMGLFLPPSALADGPGRMGDGMMAAI